MTADIAPLDISVVTHNSARWLDGFIRSLLAQSYPCERMRLLLRDNGSSDNTLALLRQIASVHAQRFASIEIDAGDNVGFGQGHNANLARAQSPWFLVTNVDLEFESQTLMELVHRARTAADNVASWECRQKPFEHPKHYNPVSGETVWSSSACTLFRVEALRQIGGYEPKLFLYGEDVEISYRLRDHGWVLHYVPRATVWHYTYEHAGQVKPAQLLGSTLANVLLRMRYGNWRAIVRGLLMYKDLLAAEPRIARQRLLLLKNGWTILRLAPYFLGTRKKSQERFPFSAWDYEFTRHGAFYRYPSALPQQALPVVSVLIRTMAGRAGKLAEAIASVAGQTYEPVELVIVEDGSDTASDVAKHWRDSGRFHAVHYRPLPKVGRCVGGNAAMEAATGEFMCFLDDDDLFYADHLEVLVDVLAQRPDLGGVYGLSYQVRTDVISAEPWVYRDIEHSLVYRQPFSRVLMWHHNYLPIQTVVFRRRLFTQYGGLDPELDNLEDWNLWVRYTLEHDFEMIDKVTSLYRVPAKAQDAAQRQHVLDGYYAKAVDKNRSLTVQLNPNQVLYMAQELAQELYVDKRQNITLRGFLVSRPGLAWLVNPLRRLRDLLRRVAARL